MTVRVLVCGSRTFSNSDMIYDALNGIDGGVDGDIHIIQGGARGADSIAGEWAAEMGRPCTVFAANWNLYGKRAGFVRNQQMLDEGKPDLVVAFTDKPLEESKGTAMMVKIASKAGVPCVTYEENI